MEKVVIGNAELYCGDCLEILPTLSGIDAVVTDPPYGLGEAAGKNRSRDSHAGANKWKGSRNTTGVGIQSTDFGFSEWDNKAASNEQIEQILLKSKIQIIFGGNFFNLPPTSCWLVWDKVNGSTDFADCELAWTNLKCAVRLKRFMWNGMLQGDMKNKQMRVHPTQKPIQIMEWCISFIPAAKTILDPFMGSGTTGVACANLGRKFIGIEIEPKYFNIACKRIEKAQAQLKLFPPETKQRPEPQKLF